MDCIAYICEKLYKIIAVIFEIIYRGLVMCALGIKKIFSAVDNKYH